MPSFRLVEKFTSLVEVDEQREARPGFTCSGWRPRADSGAQIPPVLSNTFETVAGYTPTSTALSSRTAIRLLSDTVGSLSATPQLSYARSRDGVTLAFAVTGQGPPLVLVPWVPFSNLQMEYGNPVMRQVYDQ